MSAKVARQPKHPPSQWFIECSDPFTNESVAAFLAERGIGETEAKHVGLLDHTGHPRDVWEIPSYCVTVLRKAKQSNSQFQFRFFVRHHRDAPLYPADFIEGRGLSQQVRHIQHALRRLQSRKQSS